MREFLEIIRPINCLMVLIAVLIGGFIGGLDGNLIFILLGGVSAFLISGGGMVINDYFDLKSDYFTNPTRPLPSGRMSDKAALIYSITLFVLGIYLAVFISPISVLIAILATFLLIIYSKFLQKVFLIGNIVVSFLVGLTFVYGGLAVNKPFIPLILGSMAFLANLSREIIKDAEDRFSDERWRVNSLPVKLGERSSRILASIFVLIAVLLSPLPLLLNIFGIYYLVFVLICDGLFLHAALLTLKNKDSKYLQKIMKVGMILGLIAFLIGAL